MKTVDLQALPAPPSLMSALMAGFDAIANHIGLILFPIGLDLFLWLGPHLSLARLIENMLNQMSALPGADTAGTADLLSISSQFWTLVAQRLNLLSVLRSYPVGIPSLMTGLQPVQTPSGSPITLYLPSLIGVIGVWMLLTFIGLIGGTLYYGVVAQAALAGKVQWRLMFSRLPWSSVQVLSLALFWIALLLGISIPGSCVLALVSLTGLTAGSVGIFILAGLLIWILFPLLLSAHGIFVNRRKMWVSVRDGMRLTRLTLPSTGVLFLIIIVLNEGLGLLWSVPGEASWLTLIGVMGHAFVTTALLAATFIYYRDADRWVQKMLLQAKLKSVA
jgi:hypothetical protein